MGSRRRTDFDAEIKAHLELEEAELRAAGMSEDEARRTARLRFGEPTLARPVAQPKGGLGISPLNRIAEKQQIGSEGGSLVRRKVRRSVYWIGRALHLLRSLQSG
jgi:hypothetical protein